MKTVIKPRHLLSLPALALAYAVFLVWWLNRDEGQSRRVANAFPDAANQARTKPAAMPLPAASGRSGRSGDPEKNATTGRLQSVAAGTGRRNFIPAQPVQSSEFSAFKPVLYTEGQPFYEGEPVTAYAGNGVMAQFIDRMKTALPTVQAESIIQAFPCAARMPSQNAPPGFTGQSHFAIHECLLCQKIAG